MGKRIAKPEDFGRVESRIKYAVLPERLVKIRFTLGRKVVWESSVHRTRNDAIRLIRFAKKCARKAGTNVLACKAVILENVNGKWLKAE